MKEYQLPREFAEKWVTALRSGEYKQIREALYKQDQCGYCCLGVAGVINGIPNDTMSNVGELGELSDDNLFDAYEDLRNQYKLPIDILRGDLVKILVDMNDYQKKSFHEIAEWIEKNVEFIEPIS